MSELKLIRECFNFSPENIAKIEEVKKAKWVCDVEHPAGSLNVVSVFYQEEPYQGSHYFGLYYNHSLRFNLDDKPELMIINGSWIEEVTLNGLQADNGDIIYSHHRHDMRYAKDGSCWIDGGRAYVRRGEGGIPVGISFKDGRAYLST